VPLDLLVLLAAFVTGLLGSAHCGAMCGGIAVAAALPAPPTTGPRAPLALGMAALLPNLGRIGSYTLAGALVGGLGGGLLGALDLAVIAPWLRLGVGLVLLLAALRLAAPRWAAQLPSGPAVPLWQAMAPLRRIVPATGPWRALALGALWGWLPCGLSYTLLGAAWLEGSALHGALLMLAFGLGTTPALVAASGVAARIGLLAARPAWRAASGTFMAGVGALTMAGPWLLPGGGHGSHWLDAIVAACLPSAG